MSSHRLSTSGERPYTLTAGGGPYTAFQQNAYATDAVQFQIGGAQRIEFAVPPGARLEKRRYGERNAFETVVLVIDQGGSATMAATASDEQRPGMIHSNVDVRKFDPEAPLLFPGMGEFEVIEVGHTEILVPAGS